MSGRRAARTAVAAVARKLPRWLRAWLINRLAVLMEWDRRRERLLDPAAFRDRLRLHALDEGTLGDRLADWQRADFAALDGAWLTLAGLDPGGRPVTRRAYLERPRGHSKTTDLAVQLAWLLRFSPASVRGVVAAADRDQAGLLRDALVALIRANATLLGQLVATTDTIRNPATGSAATFLSSDVASSYGLTPDFVVCDELCHWPRQAFWESLASASAKRPDAVLVVLSNAGAGRGWTWEVREAARLGSAPPDGSAPTWHFSTFDGPRAGWISEEALDEQRRLLPPGVFARLWLNRWQHAGSGLATAEEVAACLDPSRVEVETGTPGVRYVAAVDYAEKHDLTACVVSHLEPTEDGRGRFVVDRMDVRVPTPERPTPVRFVRDWIVWTAAAFGDVRFVVDDFQLAGVVQELEATYDVTRFAFRGGKGNHALALTLRAAIAEGRLAIPPGCGARADDPADDLAAELATVALVEKPGGMMRIDHDRHGHDDRAFAVGAALLALATNPGPVTEETMSLDPGGLLK